jgi:hypothetical protein
LRIKKREAIAALEQLNEEGRAITNLHERAKISGALNSVSR